MYKLGGWEAKPKSIPHHEHSRPPDLSSQDLQHDLECGASLASQRMPWQCLGLKMGWTVGWDGWALLPDLSFVEIVLGHDLNTSRLRHFLFANGHPKQHHRSALPMLLPQYDLRSEAKSFEVPCGLLHSQLASDLQHTHTHVHKERPHETICISRCSG